jgi:hypothetical protein
MASSARAVNDLRLTMSGAQTINPGDTVNVTLDVANLTTGINGVQALIMYDETVLSLLDIVPTNLGLVAPADGWVEVFFSEVGGDVTYAVAINGEAMSSGHTVATLTFVAIGEGVTTVSFRPDSPPFLTKLTAAANNSTIIPTKTGTVAITSTCSDGLFCNGLETLVGGSCQSGTAPNCSSFTNVCNNGVCNETADQCEAQPVNQGGVCNDGNFCTSNDLCAAGVCSGTPVNCSSLDNACNAGTCNPANGVCVATPINEGGSCDDGLFCTGTDSCNNGTCVSTGDPCTPLSCDEAGNICLAPLKLNALEVIYAGRYRACSGGTNIGQVCNVNADCPGAFCRETADTSKSFLAAGSTATGSNITNYMSGITGIRIRFSHSVTFATTAAAAFSFEWTTGGATTFSAVSNPGTAITVTPTEEGGATIVTIVLADNHIRRRWLKVTVLASQITTGIAALDGELTGNPVVLPSGNGVPGGNAVFFIGNVTGDVDGNRQTALADVGLIRGSVNPFVNVPITNVFDVNKDKRVQLSDVGEARLDVNPFFTLPLIVP